MHTMIEASADLSGTELELSDVTSPLLASRVITSEEEQGSSRKRIKPTKSINHYSSSKVGVGVRRRRLLPTMTPTLSRRR